MISGHGLSFARLFDGYDDAHGDMRTLVRQEHQTAVSALSIRETCKAQRNATRDKHMKAEEEEETSYHHTANTGGGPHIQGFEYLHSAKKGL